MIISLLVIFSVQRPLKHGGYSYGVQCHFQLYFSYIAAVSFIGGGNRVPRQTHRPAANHWQHVSHNVVSSIPRHERDSNSQLLWWWEL